MRIQSGLVWTAAIVSSICFCGLLWLAGCDRGVKRPVSALSSASARAATFVGSEACRECHAREFIEHQATRHAATLRPMTSAALGAQVPPIGRVPGTDIVLTRLASGYGVTVAGETDEAMPVDLAFGSGKTGMSFVAYADDQTLLELRKSYFPRSKSWYTPGHEKRPVADVGMLYDLKAGQRCVLCHASSLVAGTVRPDPAHFGVGCESCHGAGSNHAESAARRGEQVVHLDRLEAAGAMKLNTLCGTCHRTAAEITLGTDQAKQTHRFQPYGLMLSKCFTKSGDRLSCITCHDPHRDYATDARGYDKVCSTCHVATPVAEKGQGSLCSVNPKEGCVKCHMPSRRVFEQTKVPTSMADHLIGIYKSKVSR